MNWKHPLPKLRPATLTAKPFAMIDGLKLQCRISDFKAWKQATNIELTVRINTDTGEIKERIERFNGGNTMKTLTHVGNFETYRVRIKEIGKVSQDGVVATTCYFRLDGSLHKNHFNKQNFSPFAWYDLQEQISHVEKSLCLTANNLELTNLEFGVNIKPPFPVFDFLQKNLVSYKGKQFNAWKPDRYGVCLGYQCDLSQYSVKVYDKAKQFTLPEPMMRFELRFTRMQILNSAGIKTLSDLKNKRKVSGLLNLLLQGWNNTLLCDTSIDLNNPALKPNDKQLLIDGRNPKYWESEKQRLSNSGFYKKQNRFRELTKLFGSNWHEQIGNAISTEWIHLLDNGSGVPVKQVDNLTIKINSNNVHHPDLDLFAA